MSQPVNWSHLCHLKTCIWMIVASIHTGSVNLTKWSMYISRGKFAQSRAQIEDLPVVRCIRSRASEGSLGALRPPTTIWTLRVLRRIQRWLNNPRINVHRLYNKSLIQTALADWTEEKLFLALDTSLFWDEYCLIRLCVIHRGRALPLV